MSKLKYDGVPLTDLIEGNVAGRGGYSGPSTNTSSNTSSNHAILDLELILDLKLPV